MILVTGGCGFIGTQLVKDLMKAKHRVTVLDNLSAASSDFLPQEVTFVQGDIRDVNLVARLMNEAEKCFHLAAITDVQYCEDHPLECMDVNFSGTHKIFEASKNSDKKTRVIYASSAAVYGDKKIGIPNKETDEPDPKSIYGQSKLQSEIVAQYYREHYSMHILGLRFFNVYGYPFNSNSAYSGVIKKFFETLQNNHSLTIYGDGEQTRDFIHLTDVTKACLYLINKLAEGMPAVMNIGTGEPTSIRQLAQMLINLTCKPEMPTNYALAKRADIVNSLANIHSLKNIFPMFSSLPLKEGLKQLVLNDNL
jgi:UDP-glucose 4-epimerase